ncbi:tetratricopeptide repeat protein [Streptomyces sp. NPDC048845]|uniref:tetratricopeptide repeat protein n=1 Tax=Streptomyces sp. NPDC048845 TaxID=3155390 RepID=UPI003414F495
MAVRARQNRRRIHPGRSRHRDECTPWDLPVFTGRQAELDRLLAFGPGVVVLEGLAGIGKTTLATRAAHLLMTYRKLDSVLWVDLRGHNPELPPADSNAVLDGLLRQRHMPADRVRLLDAEGRAREFRKRMARARALIVLDDAANAEQVRPLLPHSPTCLTLVTSRNALAALPEALRLPLEVFTPQESLELLRRVVGADRIDHDPQIATDIAGCVGHLSLALSLVASQIRTRSGWTLADHREHLADRTTRLQCGKIVDRALDLSYQGLEPGCQRLFRLLAGHPGPRVDAYAAAALTGGDPTTACTELDILCAAHLLNQPTPGRYEFHALVRLYAAHQAHEQESPSARHAALVRLLDYHRHAASLAMQQFAPYDRHHRPPADASSTPVPPLRDRKTATAWLDTERSALVTTAVHAAEQGHPEHTGKLATLIARYLDASGHYQDALVLYSRAVRSPDLRDRACALARRGAAYWRLGRHTDAIDSLDSARATFEAIGDRSGQGWTLGNTGEVLQHLGRYTEARQHFQRASAIAQQLAADCPGSNELKGNGVMFEPLGCYPETVVCSEEALIMAKEVMITAQKIGDRVSETYILGSVGSMHRQKGRHREALAHLREGLKIAREIDHHSAEVKLLNELAITLRAASGAAAASTALTHHKEAAEHAGELRERYEEARAYDGIARCHLELQNADAAATYWHRAWTLFDQLGTPEADDIVDHLTANGLPRPRTGEDEDGQGTDEL